MRRVVIGGIAALTLSAGTAHAQEEETTPPTTVDIADEAADDVAEEAADEEEGSDNTGLWGLLGLLGLAGLAGLARRKPTYDTRTVPPTGPAAPPTAHGATAGDIDPR